MSRADLIQLLISSRLHAIVMGTFTFLLPDQLSVAATRCLGLACLAIGYDQSPVPTRRQLENGQIVLGKDSNESGYLMMPWPVEGIGVPVCLSATLRETPEPYFLDLELARGKLNQVRTRAHEWESIGMLIDESDRQALAEATRMLGQAATGFADPDRSALAGRVQEVAFDLSNRLTKSFSDQVLQTRLIEGGKLNTGLGFRVSELVGTDNWDGLTKSFSTVRLVPRWSQIEPVQSQYIWTEFDALVEAATAAGLRLSIGPLIDPDASLPSWLAESRADLPSLAAYACDFIETIIQRYRDRVRIWEVFTGLNHTDVPGLTEDDCLRLADRLLDAARSASPEGEWIIGLAQPWGDYLTSEDYTYSPLVFADTLLRAGFSLSALNLDLVGSPQATTPPRDPLEVYRLLDLFSLLNVPLEVTAYPGAATQSWPATWLDTTLHLALALPQVSSVFWHQGVGQTGSKTQPQATVTALRQQYVA